MFKYLKVVVASAFVAACTFVAPAMAQERKCAPFSQVDSAMTEMRILPIGGGVTKGTDRMIMILGNPDANVVVVIDADRRLTEACLVAILERPVFEIGEISKFRNSSGVK